MDKDLVLDSVLVTWSRLLPLGQTYVSYGFPMEARWVCYVSHNSSFFGGLLEGHLGLEIASAWDHCWGIRVLVGHPIASTLNFQVTRSGDTAAIAKPLAALSTVQIRFNVMFASIPYTLDDQNSDLQQSRCRGRSEDDSQLSA